RENRGAQHVQDHLLDRARLQARRTCDHLGTFVDLDRDVRRPAERRTWFASDRDPQSAVDRGALEGTEDEGRPSAGADPDRDVAGAESQESGGLGAEVAIVLLRIPDRVSAYAIAGHAERRRALGRIERRNQAARTGSEIVEPPTRTEAIRDRLDRPSHLA